MERDALTIDRRRIPSLDGLRAISIVLVLFGHLQGTAGFPQLAVSRWVGDLAHLGVTVFFVISGFLITSLLMSERQATGTISLKKFYLRRTLRIFPAFYVFLLALVIASLFGWLQLTKADLGFSLTYTVNYYAGRSWNVGHLWSLSIEEQFYLLWPALFMALNERRALLAALVAFFLGPLVRTGMTLMFAPPSPWRDLEIFPAMADSIAIGCVIALLRPWLLTRPWYLNLTANRFLLALVPLILAINRMMGFTLVSLLGSPIMLIGIAVLIEASTRRADSRVGRILNFRPLAFVGVLSYSLYLWQQPFLNRHSLASLNAFPLNLALTIVAALLSYYLIEKPFLNMRKRLEVSVILPLRTQAAAVDK